MAGEVIVGYDGSECAKGALSQAVEQARAFGTGVVIAFAYEPPATGPRWPTTATPSRSGQGPHRGALQLVAGSGVEAPAAVVDARPADGLLALASEQARMIVIGPTASGLHGLRARLDYKLLHRSPVPVLVVPLPSLSPGSGRHAAGRRYPDQGKHGLPRAAWGGT